MCEPEKGRAYPAAAAWTCAELQNVVGGVRRKSKISAWSKSFVVGLSPGSVFLVLSIFQPY